MKTIELLGGMHDQGSSEMKEEAVAFAKHNMECQGSLAQMKTDIENAASDIANYQALVAGAEGKIQSLSEEIAADNQDVATREGMMAEATQKRKEEHETYITTRQDLEESVSALERASNIASRLQQKNKSISQAALIQHSEMPEKALALLEVPSGQAAAYESQSGGIVALLDKLEKQFKTQLNDLEVAELNTRQSHEVEMEKWKAMNVNLNAKVDRMVASKGQQVDIKGENTKLSETTIAEKKATEDANAARTLQCNSMAKSFNDKQDLRKDELEALQKGMDVLCGIGENAKHETCVKYGSYKLLQEPVSFLQMKQVPFVSAENTNIGIFLRRAGEKLNSNMLVQLGDKIAEDPFTKVKSMIEEMIGRIQDQMQKAAEERSFCESAFSKVNTEIDNRNKKVSKLTADMDRARSTSVQLAEKVTELKATILQLNEDLTEASQERADISATNQKSIEEATVNAKAVGEAIGILTAFYTKAATATALMQVSEDPKYEVKAKDFKIGNAAWNSIGNAEGAVGFDYRVYHKEGEETFGESFTGQQDKSNVVIGILEVVQSDFTRIAVETEEAEKTAQADHDKFTQETKVALAKKTKASEMKESDSKGLATKANEKQKELQAENEQLAAAHKEKEALIADCPPEHGGTKGIIPFEQRAAQRKAEIDSLKEAHTLLKDINGGAPGE